MCCLPCFSRSSAAPASGDQLVDNKKKIQLMNEMAFVVAMCALFVIGSGSIFRAVGTLRPDLVAGLGIMYYLTGYLVTFIGAGLAATSLVTFVAARALSSRLPA